MPGRRELSPLSRREAEKRKFEEDYRKGTEELMLAEAAKEFRDCLLKAGLGKTQRRISQLLAELSRLQAERDRVLGLKQGRLEDILSRYSERFNQMEAQIAGAKGARREKIMKIREDFVQRLKRRLQDVAESNDAHITAPPQVSSRVHAPGKARVEDSEDESDLDDQPLNKRRRPNTTVNTQMISENSGATPAPGTRPGAPEERQSTSEYSPDESEPSADHVLRTSTLEQHNPGIRTATVEANQTRNTDQNQGAIDRSAQPSNTDRIQQGHNRPNDDRLSFGRIRPARARSSESDARSLERNRSVSSSHSTDGAARQNARAGVSSGSENPNKLLLGQDGTLQYFLNRNRLSPERDHSLARSDNATRIPMNKPNGSAARGAYCAMSFTPRNVPMKAKQHECIEVAASATRGGILGGSSAQCS